MKKLQDDLKKNVGGGCVTIPFNEQVAIFSREVSKVFDYVALEEFYHAKSAIYDGDWSPENVAEVLMRANYNGAVARIAYYKYVHKLGFDALALWEALVSTWLTNRVWLFDLENVIKEPEFKAELKRFRYPEWVKFGLVGGGIDDLKRMGDKFCAEMEAL